MALRDGVGPPGDYPESEYFKEKPSRPGLCSAELLAGAALTGGALLRRLTKVARESETNPSRRLWTATPTSWRV